MRTISSESLRKLIDLYISKGGEVTQIKEGVLTCGNILLHGEGLKTTVITEVFQSSWSSLRKIRQYRKTPKKYLQFTLGN